MNNNKILKASLGYTIGNYLLKGMAFFSIPVFTRLMSTEDYGLYNTFVAYESIIFVFIGFALHSCIKNAKYKYKEDFESFLSSCILLMLINFAMVVLVFNLLINAMPYKIQMTRIEVNLLLICSIGNALIVFYTTYVGLEYQYKLFLMVSALNAFLNIGLSVLLMKFVFPNNRYLGRVCGTCIPLVLISCFIVFSFYQKASPRLSKDYYKYALRISLPIIPHGISQVILSQFDRVMIRMIIGVSEAGLYSFAYNIYTIIQVVYTSLNNVWEPWFFEKMKNKEYDLIKRYATLYMTFIMIVLISILIISPEIIKLLSSKPYWDSVYVVIPILIAGYFSFLYTLPVVVEYYYEKTKYIALATGSAALVNVLLNAIFIPRYGYIAAAYTTMVTYLFYFLFHYFFSIKLNKKSILNYRILLINIFLVIFFGIFTVMELNRFFVRWGMLIIFYIAIGYILCKKYNVQSGKKCS